MPLVFQSQASLISSAFSAGVLVQPVPSSAVLGSTLRNLSEENHAATRRKFIDIIRTLSDEQKAEFCDNLHLVNSSFPAKGPLSRSPLQQTFLYELACETAGSWAVRQAREDLKLGQGEFHQKTKYGPYDPNTNNCVQYVLRLYYLALRPFFSDELGALLDSKMYYGRPAKFVFGHSDSSPVLDTPSASWASNNDAKKKRALGGDQVAFTSRTFSSKDIAGLSKYLQTGDMVSVDVSPHTGNRHAGIYDGKGNVINIGRPLYKDTLKAYVRKARTVTVQRLVKWSAVEVPLRPTEEPNPFKPKSSLAETPGEKESRFFSILSSIPVKINKERP